MFHPSFCHRHVHRLHRSCAKTRSLLGGFLLGGLLLAPSLRAQVVSEIDRAFAPTFNSSFVSSLAPLPDGKFLVGGSFDTVNGQPRNLVAKLNPDGSLDPSFTAPPNTAGEFQDVFGMLLDPNGKIYVSGVFTTLGGIAASYVARLNPDGSHDTTFNSALVPNSSIPRVTSMALQPDGKLLVSGLISSVDGHLVRLNANGSRDTTFTPPVPLLTNTRMTLLSNGKIMLFGSVRIITGQFRGLALLNPDGTVDGSYNPTVATGSVSSLQELPDGRVMIFGGFSEVNGTARPGAAILNPDGSLDPAYAGGPQVSGSAGLSQLQADGSVIGGVDIGGGSIFRRRLDGSIDPSFQLGGFSFGVSMLLGDGRILFGPFNGALTGPQDSLPFAAKLARVQNDLSVSVITVVNAGEIRWLRGGTAPATNRVFFDYSADGQTNWTTLGSGVWLGEGVWGLSGLSVPNAGYIRGRARLESYQRAQQSKSEGYTGQATAYNLSAPILRVERPTATPLTGGATVNFAASGLGRDRTIDFTIRNLGSAALSGLGITFSGPAAGQFHLATAPAISVSGPGGTTTFRVRFTPTSPGAKSATLTLASNDPTQPSFALALTGSGVAIGDADPNFDPKIVRFNPAPVEAPGSVYAAAETPEGKLVIGGIFDAVGGRARTNLARLEANSAADLGFNTKANGTVNALAIADDGKVIVGGAFTQLNGTTRNGIGRYNADGTLDPAFDPATGTLSHVLLQPDGKMIVASMNGAILRRLQADGATDATFAPTVLLEQSVVLLRQPDGKLVLSHRTFSNGDWVTRLQRLTTTGALDPTFQATDVANSITALALQGDGRIVYGGLSNRQGGGIQPFLARLNADGSPDNTLAVTATGTTVYTIALQADGKILVGGLFTDLAGPAANVARLFSDGSRDSSFTGTADEAVLVALAQADGDLVYGGQFSTTLVSILQSGTSVVSAITQDRVQWSRGGSVPEVMEVTFDLSTDGGTTWSRLGDGSRIAGGWELSGLQLPALGQVRARGRAQVSGHWAGSSSLSEARASFSFSLRQIATWRTLHGLPADGSQDLANPSGDGIQNLLKFAFNMAPASGELLWPNVAILPANGTAGLPAIGRDAQGRLVVDFVRRKAITDPGIVYQVETGADLTNWGALDLGAASVTSINSVWERVSVTDPTPGTRRFGRVRVLGFNPYTNDFTLALDRANLRGSAQFLNNAVRLTDQVSGQVGALVLEGIEAGPAFSGFTARFTLNIGPTNLATAADGVSFAAGDLGPAAWGEQGPGTAQSLAIGFDTFDNGGDGVIGIHVWVNGVRVGFSPTNPFTNGVNVSVEISYDAGLGVTVKFNGATVLNQIPTTGLTLPVGSKFGFGARTGGFSQIATIDDVNIAPR